MLLVVMLTSCIQEDIVVSKGGAGEGTYIKFALNVPRQETKHTRAQTSSHQLTEESTRALDFTKTSILLFQDGKFVENCAFDSSNVVEDTQSNNYLITLNHLSKSGTFDFVFIGNHVVADFPVGTKKSDLLSSLDFEVQGEWGINNHSVPMWGEARNIRIEPRQGVVNGGKAFDVKMLRSMARLDFRYNSSYNYKIGEIYIFNALNKGTVVPSVTALDTDGMATKPTIPSNVQYNASAKTEHENQPYLYFSDTDINEQGLLTLLPESDQLNATDEERVSVVIGVYFKDKSIRYFKIEFKNSEGELINILRNYRYIISVDYVRGEGYKTAIEAANNPAEGIGVDIVDLYDDINETYVVRSKYIALENVTHTYAYYSGDERRYKYDTNYTQEELELIASNLSWSKGKLFDAKFDYEAHQLVVTTKGYNFSYLQQDYLYIYVGDEYKFTVKVEQDAVDLSMLCNLVSVKGEYKEGEPLDDSHYINVTLESTEQLTNGEYYFYVPEVDGISFEARGELKLDRSSGKKFYQVIQLHGKGTPTKAGDVAVQIESNLKLSCSALIKVEAKSTQPVYGNMLIVGLQSHNNGADYGYVLEQGTAGNKFLTSEQNFGLGVNATVKMPSIKDWGIRDQQSIKSLNLEEGGYFAYPMSNQDQGRDFRELLTGGKGRIPDVVIVSSSEQKQLTQDFARILDEYVNRKGVVIMMLDKGQTAGDFINKYTGTDLIETNEYGQSYEMLNLSGNLVFDGPFGRLEGLSWGTLGRVSDLKQVNSSAFTTLSNVKGNFKGAGIIVSNTFNHNIAFIAYNGFAVDALFGVDNNTGAPIAKNGTNNSIIFANLFNWALDRAQNNGVKSR